MGWGRRTDPPPSYEAAEQYLGTDLSAGRGSWLPFSSGAMGGLAERREPCAEGSGVGLAG